MQVREKYMVCSMVIQVMQSHSSVTKIFFGIILHVIVFYSSMVKNINKIKRIELILSTKTTNTRTYISSHEFYKSVLEIINSIM